MEIFCVVKLRIDYALCIMNYALIQMVSSPTAVAFASLELVVDLGENALRFRQINLRRLFGRLQHKPQTDNSPNQILPNLVVDDSHSWRESFDILDPQFGVQVQAVNPADVIARMLRLDPPNTGRADVAQGILDESLE